jgi:hypothetical protein
MQFFMAEILLAKDYRPHQNVFQISFASTAKKGI